MTESHDVNDDSRNGSTNSDDDRYEGIGLTTVHGGRSEEEPQLSVVSHYHNPYYEGGPDIIPRNENARGSETRTDTVESVTKIENPYYAKM